MNIFKLHEQKPVRLGHKKANNDKKSKMEEKGQLNLFEKKPAKIFSIEKKISSFEQAFLFDEKGDNHARQLYLKAIEENDCSADAFCNLGILEAHDGNYVKAIDYFSHALATEPRHFEAHFNLANLYFDIEDLKLARLHYEMAMKIDPDDANIYFNLGLVQAMQQDIDAAIDSLSAYSKMAGSHEAAKTRELLDQLTHSKKA